MTANTNKADATLVLQAQAALNAHVVTTGAIYEERDAFTHLVDLLADLRHWGDVHHISFDDANVIAMAHWRAEVDEEPGQVQTRRHTSNAGPLGERGAEALLLAAEGM